MIGQQNITISKEVRIEQYTTLKFKKKIHLIKQIKIPAVKLNRSEIVTQTNPTFWHSVSTRNNISGLWLSSLTGVIIAVPISLTS